LRYHHIVDIVALNKTPSTLPPSEGFPTGKTLPPFSQLIEAERCRWAPFRRALPKVDQVIFDKLFDCAKLRVQAGVMVSRSWPFETIVIAVLLEQEKRIEKMVRGLEESTQFIPIERIHWEAEPNSNYIEVELLGRGTTRFALLSYAIPLSVDM
jgi:hypothetical protein